MLLEKRYTLLLQREAIVSTFTQAAGALTAVDADWIVATDFEEQPTGTANIQYVTANVMEYQDALGLQASAVGFPAIFTNPNTLIGTISMTAVVRSRVQKYSPRSEHLLSIGGLSYIPIPEIRYSLWVIQNAGSSTLCARRRFW